MKKRIIVCLTAALVLFGALGAAGMTSFAKEAADPQADETGETFSCGLFSVTVPGELAGTYEAETDGNVFRLYDSAEKEAGFGGAVFSLSAYAEPDEYAGWPGAEKVGELTAADGTLYDVVLTYPTEVQWDYTGEDPTKAPEAYAALYDAAEGIAEHLIPAEGGDYGFGAGCRGEGMYDEVLKKHISAIEEEWDANRLEEEEMSPMYCAIAADADSPGEVLDRVGYIYDDVDLDGIDELLIGEIAEGEWKGVIYDMYSMVNREPVHVVSGWDRNRYYVSGCFLCNEFSGGAGLSGLRVYAPVANEGRLFPQVSFKYDAYGNEGEPWFVSFSTDDEEDEAWESMPEDEWTVFRARFEDYRRYDYIPLSSLNSAADAGSDAPEAGMRAEAEEDGRGVLTCIWLANMMEAVRGSHESVLYEAEFGDGSSRTVYADEEYEIEISEEKYGGARVRTKDYDYIICEDGSYSRFVAVDGESGLTDILSVQTMMNEVTGVEKGEDGTLTVTARTDASARREFTADADTYELRGIRVVEEGADGAEEVSAQYRVTYDGERILTEKIRALEAHLAEADDMRTVTLHFDEGTPMARTYVYEVPVGDGFAAAGLEKRDLTYSVDTERSVLSSEEKDNDAEVYQVRGTGEDLEATPAECYPGTWAERSAERVVLTIRPSEEEDWYDAEITWREDLPQKDVYTMRAHYQEDGSLYYEDCTYVIRTFGEDGTYEDAVQYEDGAGLLYFSADEDVLYWTDYEVDPQDDNVTVFIRADQYAEDMAEETEEEGAEETEEEAE